MIDNKAKIYVAGHLGMVGNAVINKLRRTGHQNIIFKSSRELDLRNYSDVERFIDFEKPDIIINAAAKVGGILANNTHPYEFLMDNMLIQNNLIRCSHNHNIEKFIFLGSSCIYPKMAAQPISERSLLTSPLEKTNQWYALAKISGVKLIEALNIQYNRKYISLMPTNLYGPNDNFNLETSHVVPAMIRKFHEAKNQNHSKVKLWGSGSPFREFLHVDDLASAVEFVLTNNLSENIYNVGFGQDITIKKLSELIQKTVGHKGKIYWDNTKPDGTPRKLLDSSKLNSCGWKPLINLEDGIEATYNWYLKNLKDLKS